MPKSNKSKNRSFKNKNNSLKKRNINRKTKNKTKKRLRGGSSLEGTIKNKNKTMSRHFNATLQPLRRGPKLPPLVHPKKKKWIYSNKKWTQGPRLLAGEKTKKGQLISREQDVQLSPSILRRMFRLRPKYNSKTLKEKIGSSAILNDMRELPLNTNLKTFGTNEFRVMNNKLHDILAAKAIILTMERGETPNEFQTQALRRLSQYFDTPEQIDNFLREQGQNSNIHPSLLNTPLFPKRLFNPRDMSSRTLWRQFDKMTSPSTPTTTPKSPNQNNILHLSDSPGISSSSNPHDLGNTKRWENSKTKNLKLELGPPNPTKSKSLKRSKATINLGEGVETEL